LRPSPVHAQTRVGEAAVVKNEVVRVAGPSTSRINVGDAVLRDENRAHRPRQRGKAGDGPTTPICRSDRSATIKLDRTVFDDEHHYRDIAIRMTSGAFRFVTGGVAESGLQDHHAARDHRRARHHP